MNGIMITDNNQLSEVYENDLCEALKKIREMEDFISTVKGKLYEEMEERGIVKIDTDRIKITKVSDTTKEKFDTKAFKAKNPELYDEFCGIVSVKGYLKIEAK